MVTTIKKMNSQLYNPAFVFVSNGEVYIADRSNHRVRKVLQSGQIVTIAGTGIALESQDTMAMVNQPPTPICTIHRLCLFHHRMKFTFQKMEIIEFVKFCKMEIL